MPLTLNKILLTVLSSMEVILIPARLQMSGLSAKDALSIYGVFTGMALPLILFPATITNSAAVMLLPSITELQTLGYQKRIQYVVHQIFRYCLLFGGFCMILFLFFGEFFGNFCFTARLQVLIFTLWHISALFIPQYDSHQCIKRTWQIRNLPDSQYDQYLYPGMFCIICYSSFRNTWISVWNSLWRTCSYPASYVCIIRKIFSLSTFR